jgi:uncharacterized damage-inducible protein DinB
MTTQNLIASSLLSVRKELEETFPRLTDELLPWAPSEGMRTIHGQFVEILSTEQSITDRIKGGDSVAYRDREKTFWEIHTLAGIIGALNEIRQDTLAILANSSDEELGRIVTVSKDFSSWLELPEVSVSEMLRFLARHESYHAGQLVSYLWMRGDNPYNWD